MNYIRHIVVLVLALMSTALYAQTVSGTVTDDNNQPLPGATIVVQGTNTGTTTDFDGNYQIRATQGQTLVFSYVGYATQNVVVSSATHSVSLQSDNTLDEVVVVAYGTQSKASLTGSVSLIDADQIENATFSNPVKSLEGLVSGLRIIQANGQPGSDPVIRIRGFGSINADNEPLIVLDGIPYSGSLSSINPQDIETTSVLKDASSTSLYGNKASNGVLLITTKKGRKNKKPTVSFDTRYGITQRGTKEYNIIKSPKEFYESYHSVLANSEFYKQNAAGTPITIQQARQYASNNLIEKLGYNIYNVSDKSLVDPTTGKLNTAASLMVNERWEDALFRNDANFTSTNINISGGEENIDYYFSLGTEENNGYTVRSNFKRHTARLKVNVTEIANSISLGGDVSYTKSNSQAVPSTFNNDGTPGTFFSNAFFWTRRIAPIYPVYQYDKDWRPVLNPNNPSGYAYDFGSPQTFADGSKRGPRNYAVGEHPLAVIENTTETNERNNFNFALRAKIDLSNELKFEYIVNYLTEIDLETDFTKPGAGAFAKANNGLLNNSRDNFSAFTNQQLLTWKKDINHHSFDALLGHETYTEKFTTLSLSKRNIIGDFSPVLNNTSVYASADNYNTKYATEGYFSRFIYGLNNTYFATLTGRYDASSVFHPDERWGAFWSAGASWVLSNEGFLKNSKAVDYAKIALNYGTTGNDRIFYADKTNGDVRNLVAYENQYEISENNGSLTQTLFSLGSKEISWEKSASFNISYEMSLFDRFSMSLGYYKRKTKDLLFNTPLKLSTGQSSRPENFGSMVNTGIEAEVAWDAVKKNNIKISFNANLSTLKNEIKELPRDSIQVGNFRRVVGKSIYDYFMVKFAGVNPANGNAQYYTIDQETKEIVKTEDHALATKNGRMFLGKRAIPDITGGFGTNFQIHNFNLNLQFAYQIGGYGLDNEYFGLLGATQNITNFPDYNKTWTVDNPRASLPRVDPLSPNQYRLSDLRLISLSYLSLSNINLSYLLQNKTLKKHHIDSVKLYSTINNAFLLSSARQGYDPRLSLTGVSASEYGANRTIALGLTINFN